MSDSVADQRNPTAGSSSGMLRQTRDVVLTLVVTTILCLSVFALIKGATDTHWLLGAAATAFYAYGTYLGIDDLRSRRAQLFALHKGVAVASLTAASAIAVAASASLLLSRTGWALYEPTPQQSQEYATFAGYYVWVLLDMLPGMKVPELLSFEVPPLKPRNAVAGIPVIAFRTFIFFGLLAALKAWWQAKRRNVRDPEA